MHACQVEPQKVMARVVDALPLALALVVATTTLPGLTAAASSPPPPPSGYAGFLEKVSKLKICCSQQN